MTPQQFIAKWQASKLKEKAACQSHFNDLCGVLGYPRIIPKDEECAAKLKKRTLTNLYNERPAWLAHAHTKLDEAVFAAYGWPPDLSDDALLAKLLALNLERAG